MILPMDSTPNPYQPPAESTILAEADWARQADGRIGFELQLSERDIRRLFKNPLSAGPFLLVFVLLLSLFGMGGIPMVVVLFVVGLVVLLLLIRTRLNWKMALRQTPRLLEPATGHISERGVYTSGPGYQGYVRWEDFQAIRTTKHCVLLSGENWRLVSMIIPWAAFSDPTAAQQALESVLRQRKAWRPLTLGDPRLRADPVDDPLFQPEGPHVDFQGEVTFGEIAASAAGKKLSQKIRRWILVAVALLMLAGFTILSDMLAVWLVGIPLLMFAVGIIVQLLRHPLVRGGTGKVAFRSRGWFSETGFFLQSVTGQSSRQWPSLDHQWHDESMLCICLPGVSEGWFFFSRGQFASDEDYRQACRWAEAGLGGSRA